jgi:hypothetical protein
MNPFPLIGPSNESRSANYSSRRCVNMYLEAGGGKSPALLVNCPGLTAPLVTLSGGGIRGMYQIDLVTAVMVCGANVYKVTSSFATTVIGTVDNDNRPVHIGWNGTNIAIASAGSLYSLTLTGTASTLIRTGINGLDVLGDFFICSQSNSNQFVWSDAQSVNFDALNIQDTNSVADTLLGVRVSRRAAYFFGTKSIEPWYESGGADLPFSRIEGGVFEVGCWAKDSIAEMDGLFWLGGDDKGAGIVWSITGGVPKRISTHAIEYAIAQWPDPTDAEAFTHTKEGHSFYVLSSISGDETWVYDINTNEWHQRASMDALVEPPAAVPGWNTENEAGDWTFTNSDFTAEATP